MADSTREAQLKLTITEAGAKETAAEIQKINTTSVSLQQELGKISRTDQLRALGTDMGALAKKTGDVGQAVADLTKKLTALGATEDEIKGVAAAFNDAQSAGEGGGSGGNLLQRAGSGLRSLPSIQIPGAGIGTDAIANITRLTGALGEASGVTGLMTTATTALTPVLGATAAGVAGVTVVAGPLVVLLGILALGLKALGDQAAEEAKSVNATVDAQRAVAKEIADGLTTEDAQKKLAALNAEREAEAKLLAKNQQVYDDNVNSAGLLSGVLKAVDGGEQALSEQIQKSKDILAANEVQTNALTQAVEGGTTAANDAKIAEEKLAETRSKTALSAADTAGKELAAQQKALANTEEGNKKRLTSIEDEKAVIEKQIEVLRASGVTSDEVTKKLESLNTQLGSLGKESDFIKTTALEVSRQNDADKKAKKDAEDAAKKAEQAQTQYTKAVDGASRAYKNSVQDIGTHLNQTLTDNTTKLNRDLENATIKHGRDELELTLKANRAERNAQLDLADDLNKIRADTAKETTQALQDGDFKQLFLARQKGVESLKAEQETAEKSRLKRELAASDARADERRAFEYQRTDRVRAYAQQNIDARTAQQRELQQAALTRQRALQIASEGQNASLAQLTGYWQKFNAIQQSALKAASGGASSTTQSAAVNAFASSFTTAVRR